MIHPITTFTGRETMLTKGIKNTVKEGTEYVSFRKIYPQKANADIQVSNPNEVTNNLNAEINKIAADADYQSPFMPVSQIKPEDGGRLELINKSYEISHAPMKNEEGSELSILG